MNTLDNAIDDYLKSHNKDSQNALAFHLFNAFDEMKLQQMLHVGCINLMELKKDI